MLKYASIISGIVIVCISFFFIRNVIVTGSFFGFNTFVNQSTNNIDTNQVEEPICNTPKACGLPFFYTLFQTRWAKTTAKSFVCCLGYMKIYTQDWVYIFYFSLAIIGLIGCLIRVIFDRDLFKKYSLLYLCFPICIIIPFLLSAIFTYTVSFQPQGRYLYCMIVPLNIIVVIGIETIVNGIFKLIKQKYNIKNLDKIKLIVKRVIFSVLIIIILYIMFVLVNELLIRYMLN